MIQDDTKVRNWRVPGPFSKDRFYFLRYYRNCFFLFLLIDIVLIALRPPQLFGMEFRVYELVLSVVSLYLGGLSGVFMHNAAHSNFKPRWMNRVIGEVLGVHQLYGYHGWKTAHLVHHFFPDNPEFDPHPPGEMPYLQFAFSMQRSLRQCLTRLFYRTWGRDEALKRIWERKNKYALAGIILKILFWWLLLTPKYFLLIFVPSYLGSFFFFTHFNYFTHRRVNSSGGIEDHFRTACDFEILNLNDTAIYKVLNFLLFGVYFHRNHHERANLFNPSKLKR